MLDVGCCGRNNHGTPGVSFLRLPQSDLAAAAFDSVLARGSWDEAIASLGPLLQVQVLFRTSKPTHCKFLQTPLPRPKLNMASSDAPPTSTVMTTIFFTVFTYAALCKLVHRNTNGREHGDLFTLYCGGGPVECIRKHLLAQLAYCTAHHARCNGCVYRHRRHTLKRLPQYWLFPAGAPVYLGLLLFVSVMVPGAW
jgi:hypothetical protein